MLNSSEVLLIDRLLFETEGDENVKHTNLALKKLISEYIVDESLLDSLFDSAKTNNDTSVDIHIDPNQNNYFRKMKSIHDRRKEDKQL
jgi:hypothetical protein